MSSTYNKFRESLFASSGEEHKNKMMGLISEYPDGTRLCQDLPITLEDVLMAFGKKDIPVLIDQDGLFQFIEPNYETKEEMVKTFRWQLGKPAHEQSDETLIQITKLLINL